MVQVGNEINHGLVWPEGSFANTDQLAQLINAGTSAVKAVAPQTIMMLHVAWADNIMNRFSLLTICWREVFILM
jgi:beta-galactosidase